MATTQTQGQTMKTEGQAASAYSQAKKIREYEKHIWLLTYAAGSKDLNPEMLHDAGIKCDECYTITWRESKYTLIHLNSMHRMRLTQMKKAMRSLNYKHGIISSTIEGYESFSCNNKIEENIKNHPGFKRMVELLDKDISEIRSWLETEDISSNKKGIFWKYLNSQDPTLEHLTKKQLISYAKNLEEKLEESRKQESSFSPRPINSPGPKNKPPSTRSILLNYRRNREARDAMRRVIKMEKRMNKRDATNGTDHSGEIYAAWNSLMPNLHKQGFSFSDAETRVRALQTAGVLEPFKLVRSAKVPDARVYEKAMHIYFKDVRVYKRKEFFATSNDEINQFFDMVEGTGRDEDEKEQWAYALAKAQK